MTGRRGLLAALVLVAVAAVGCGPAAAASATPTATTEVDLPKSYRFAPEAIVVEVGSTVTWTNHDDFTHNVALPGEEPLMMSPGESVSWTFDEPGQIDYVCSLHPRDMTGTVLVTEP
jgi:plastocyanin